MTPRSVLLPVPVLALALALAGPASASSRAVVADDPVGDANVAASSEAKLPQAGATVTSDGVVVGAGLSSGSGGTSSPVSLSRYDLRRTTILPSAREVRWSVETIDRSEGELVLELYGGTCGVLSLSWAVGDPVSLYTCAGRVRTLPAPEQRATSTTWRLPRTLPGLAPGTRYDDLRATTIMRAPAFRAIVDTAGDNTRAIVL